MKKGLVSKNALLSSNQKKHSIGVTRGKKVGFHKNSFYTPNPRSEFSKADMAGVNTRKYGGAMEF